MTIYAYFNRPAASIKVSGPDAASYLQGQFSNDLRQAAGSVAYGLFLNSKGKVVADAHVLKLAEESFLVTSGFSPSGLLRQRLEDFIVADDVALEDVAPTTSGLSLWGTGCRAEVQQFFQAVPLAERFVRRGDLMVYPGRRTKAENFEVIGPDDLNGKLREQILAHGGIEAATDRTEYLRITQGIPSIPQDIGPGDLPNEGRLEDEAISYTKGCYLGQEVMARLKNMGQVRRRLFVVQGTGMPPGAGAPIFQHERKLGEIRSTARLDGGFVAMAMLNLLNLDEAAGFSLEAGAPPTLKLYPRG